MTTQERLARAGPVTVGSFLVALFAPGGIQLALASCSPVLQCSPAPVTISIIEPIKVGDGLRVTPPAVISLTEHISIASVTDGLGPPSPTANAGGPYTAPIGVPTDLTGSGSDPNHRPLTFAWDLDGSGTFGTPGQVITVVTSGRPGDLVVKLRVCDDLNLCATSSAIVQVVSAPDGGGTGGIGTGPPSANATPELDSLLLFGTGLSGLGAYALARLRARRRAQG